MKLSARLADAVLRRPWHVLAIALVVNVASAPLILGIQFGGAFTDLFPDSSEASRAYADFMRRFGAQKSLAVLFTADDPVALKKAATRFADAAAANAEIEEVIRGVDLDAVASLDPAEVLGRVGPDAYPRYAERLSEAGLEAAVDELKAMLTSPVSPPRELILGDPFGLAQLLRADADDDARATVDPMDGTFRSPDGLARLVLLRPHGSPDDRHYSARLLASLDGIFSAAVADLPPEANLSVGYTGSYAYVVAYATSIQADLTRVSLIALLLSVALYLAFFRRLRGGLLTLLALGAAVGPTFALAAQLFGGFNQISAAASAIIFGLGIDAGIHIYNEFAEQFQNTHDRREALHRTLTALTPVLMATAGTSSLVLGAVMLSRFRGLSELGGIAAVGLALTALSMLTVFPALLTLAGGAPPRPLHLPVDRWMGWLSRRPVPVVAVGGLMIVAGVLLAPRIPVQDDPAAVVAGDLPPEKVQADLERHFGVRYKGALLLVERPSLEEALRAGDLISHRLGEARASGLVGAVDSITPLFPAATTRAENLARFGSLDMSAAAERARAALLNAGLKTEAFEPYLKALAEAPAAPIAPHPPVEDLPPYALQYVRPGSTGGVVVATWVYALTAERAAEERLLDWLGPVATETGATLTGYPALRREFSSLLSGDSGLVLGLGIAGVLLALFLHLRSPRAVLLTLAPMAVAFGAFASVLALAGLHLSVFTLPVLPLVLGIGVDDHLYLLDRWRREGGNRRLALEGAGRAVTLTTLTTVAGFGALSFAGLPALRYLGLITAIGVLICLGTALGVMPALLSWTGFGNEAPPKSGS